MSLTVHGYLRMRSSVGGSRRSPASTLSKSMSALPSITACAYTSVSPSTKHSLSLKGIRTFFMSRLPFLPFLGCPAPRGVESERRLPGTAAGRTQASPRQGGQPEPSSRDDGSGCVRSSVEFPVVIDGVMAAVAGEVGRRERPRLAAPGPGRGEAPDGQLGDERREEVILEQTNDPVDELVYDPG